MKQLLITTLTLAAIFAIANYLNKGDEIAMNNLYMVERCTADNFTNCD